MEQIQKLREMMKSYTAQDEDFDCDMQHNLPKPALSKYYEGSKRLALPTDYKGVITNNNFFELLSTRKSQRTYSDEYITLEELSLLLYATQGVRKVLPDNKATLRNVPSGGAIHPFETYIYVNKVKGLEKGLYLYLPIEHELEILPLPDDFISHLTEGFCGQSFLTMAPVSFYWSLLPYRCEWKYASKAHRVALMEDRKSVV